MATSFKRHIAYKVCISDLLGAEYVKRGGWEPNYCLTKYGQVSRVNLLAFVVSIPSGTATGFLIDDGTGNLPVRVFDESVKVPDIKMGDLVLIIGRPKEWNASKYLVPEVIRKVDDREWMVVRKKEIALQGKGGSFIKEEPKAVRGGEGPYQRLLKTIADLDKGEGAELDAVVHMSGVKDAELTISSLIEEGEIFQVRPGRLKLLD